MPDSPYKSTSTQPVGRKEQAWADHVERGVLTGDELEKWRGWITSNRLGAYAHPGNTGGPYLRMSRLIATIDALVAERDRLVTGIINLLGRMSPQDFGYQTLTALLPQEDSDDV